MAKQNSAARLRMRWCEGVERPMSNDGHNWQHRWCRVMLVGARAGAALCVDIAQAQEPAPDPRLLEQLGILTSQRRLDPRNNRLDALVSQFGSACTTDPRPDTRPCPFERRLLTFRPRIPLCGLNGTLQTRSQPCASAWSAPSCADWRDAHAAVPGAQDIVRDAHDTVILIRLRVFYLLDIRHLHGLASFISRKVRSPATVKSP
jgi:hypothetical protein